MAILLIGKNLITGDVSLTHKDWKKASVKYSKMDVRTPYLSWEEIKGILRCMHKKYENEADHSLFERSLRIARNALTYRIKKGCSETKGELV